MPSADALDPRGAHLLAQVRCAVINGDLREKLKAYEAANVEEISPQVQYFLGQLNRGGGLKPQGF
jgi:hypothetical protein